MSGQQERIPTGAWREVYSICHARIKVRSTETKYHTTATHSGLRWRNKHDKQRHYV